MRIPLLWSGKHAFPTFARTGDSMKTSTLSCAITVLAMVISPGPRPANAQDESANLALPQILKGKRLFEQETFGGNGRTCLTCHTRETGTISPRDVSAGSHRILAIRFSSTTEAMMGTDAV